MLGSRRSSARVATLAEPALLAQLVEHFHGKEGVDGSSPSEGFRDRPGIGTFGGGDSGSTPGRSRIIAGVPEPAEQASDDELGLDRGGVVEEIVFGTRALSEVASIVDHFCARELGAGISEVLFRVTSVGVVVGARLDDGRRVVVKAHQPRETRTRLEAVQEIQSDLHRAGLPCPVPLTAPVALVNGHATAETLIDEGEFRNTHDPDCRRLIAQALAWHLEITAARSTPDALIGGWSLFDGDRLWPAQAHSPTFDFEATGSGAEWLDALAARAKTRLAPTGQPIAGHSDWSGKHFRFASDKITAIYDWDSLAVRTEAELVGVAAMTYTTRFDLPHVSRVPTPAELAAFIDEYSTARKHPLNRTERNQIAAHALFLAAYTARCEHCGVDGYDAEADSTSFTAALRTHGSDYLTA